MVGAERLDVLGLPRGKLSGTDSAEVEGVVGDSTTAALPNQLFVGANADPLAPLVADPPPSLLRLGQEVRQVAPERFLRAQDTGRDRKGIWQRLGGVGRGGLAGERLAGL